MNGEYALQHKYESQRRNSSLLRDHVPLDECLPTHDDVGLARVGSIWTILSNLTIYDLNERRQGDEDTRKGHIHQLHS